MGIVVVQSVKNTLTTYLGFIIGGINVFFLYTNFMSDAYFGLVTFIFSTANVLMPLMAFGAHHTVIRFYSSYKTRQSQNSFLIFAMLLPFTIAIPMGMLCHFFYNSISVWLTATDVVMEDYIWLIYFSAIAFAYFELFYAWSRVHMQSVVGNFMKELFHRVSTTILLFSLYLEFINVNQFVYAVVGVYIIRVFVMMLYAFSIRLPPVKLVKLKGIKSILKYTALIVFAGSIANIVLELDKVMLGYYIEIENVAYYSVAIYIASVIGVPSQAMEQIISPITAKLLNEGNNSGLKSLYQKSSLSLFIIGGLIFLLIVLNINELYLLIPEKYEGGLLIVVLISLAKLTDNLLGNNTAIIYNSNYYVVALIFGGFLMLSMVVLNMILIPKYGINGAALATFAAVLSYNIIKIIFVKYAFGMLPFTFTTLKVLVLVLLGLMFFYFWNFPFHPILNIMLKSVLVSFMYGSVVYYFNFSNDVSQLIKKTLKLFR
ncbi:oligosaccharide flippase family protein [Flavobacteriaceae bacterium XHP0103]|uniref:lipopolysaccharide biosynthesis protein n=1 Tax=Marixanthotalea marina TaxID=2844359 RepID=UPI002989E1CB|nr:oligosaccharide flippase family protein [Marixanthotalea marina]MBU3822324.1 oligosaccharide flippase family protein [Marixanthotalea marina]